MENVLKQNRENELLWRKRKQWEQQEGLVTALFRILPILHKSAMTSAEQNVPAEMSCVQSDEGKIIRNKICWSLIKNERKNMRKQNKTKKQCYTHSPFSRFLKIPIFFSSQYSNTVKIKTPVAADVRCGSKTVSRHHAPETEFLQNRNSRNKYQL